MRDAVTVARKELLELLGDRGSRRGGLFQAGVVLALCGLFLPWTHPALLLDPRGSVMLYVVFPSLLSAIMSADAFAGERERRTLETLLATPVSDAAVFFGKVLGCAAFGWGGALACLALAVPIAAGRGVASPAPHVLLLLLGASSAALLTASVGTFVSLKMEGARAAQQVTGFAIMGLALGLGTLLEKLPGDPGTTRLLLADAVLVLAAAAVLSLAVGLFGRDRLFDRR